MTVFVDTSVWSIAFRPDVPVASPETVALSQALSAGEVYSTGIVLQELLQGFKKPKASAELADHFRAIPLLIPDRKDHEEAALMFASCRRRGIQTGTVDVLLAQLCIRNNLKMLTVDKDFQRIAKATKLTLWQR